MYANGVECVILHISLCYVSSTYHISPYALMLCVFDSYQFQYEISLHSSGTIILGGGHCLSVYTFLLNVY